MDDAAALAAARAFGSPAGPPCRVGAGPSPLFDVTLADGRRVALRLHADIAAQVVADRMRLAEALADAALPTPWPQRTRDGALIHADGGVVATALQWVAARPLGLAPCGPARGAALHDLGMLLADFHLTADAVAPADLALPDLRPAVPSGIDAFDFAGPDRAALARAGSGLDESPVGVVHGGGSVLCSADGLWLAGIDRYAGIGWRAQDLAAVLAPHGAAPDLPDLQAALAAGYVAGGGAASETASDRVGLCLALRAIAACDAAGPDRAAVIAQAVALVRAVFRDG